MQRFGRKIIIIWTTGKKIVVALIAVMLITVLAAMFLNYIPNPFYPYQSPAFESNDPNVEVIPLSMQEGLEIFKDFPIDVDLLDKLNTKFYGINNKSYTDVMNVYNSAIIPAGWTLCYNEVSPYQNLNYTIKGYYRGLMGQFILTYGSCPDFTTVLVTTSGLLSDYWMFGEFGG